MNRLLGTYVNVLARVIAVLVAFVVLWVAPASAGSPWDRIADPVFVRPDTRDLPEPAAMVLAQDRAGFVWVGTQGGLARYDGVHFLSFLPNPSDGRALPDGYIRALLPDADGGLWIGSSSSGLVRFDAAHERFRTWRADPRGRRGPRSASVNAIVAAGGGPLWIGGDGGLDAFTPATGTFAPLALTAAPRQPVVLTAFVDHRRTLWVGTQSGLFARGARERSFHAVTLPAAAAVPAVYSLAEGRDGRLWVGSVDALFVFDRSRRHARALTAATQRRDTLAPGQQWSIIEITPGTLWVGTDSAISIVDEATLHVRRIAADEKNPGGLAGGRVLQFLRDRSGMVWLADHVGGLLLYNPLGRGLYELSGSRPEIGFSEQGVAAIAAGAHGVLWAGGLEGRVAAFDPRRGRIRTLTVPNRGAVQTLLVGRHGTLWIGTTNGLCRLGVDDAAPVCPATPAALANASVYALLEEGSRLWVGSNAGLVTVDTRTRTVTPFASATAGVRLSNTQVRALLRDRRGRLWVGTENGLNRVDRDGTVARYVFSPDHPDAIGPGGVTSLFEDRRGRLWVGMEGGPLDVLEETRGGGLHVRKLSLADGMPHENVNALAADPRGRIWASTDNGIALIDPVTLRARGFGLADGVPGGAFWAGAVAQAADGTTFFGGLQGITIVAPDAASPWRYAPPVVVSALGVGRRSVAAGTLNTSGAVLDLPTDARDVNVEFAALDYSAPQAVRYQYRLEGYDRDWVDADAQHRVANYTHLAPGDYTLLVRATNRLGIWNPHVFRIALRAAPAWYETWWFRLLVAVLVLVGVYGLHCMRTAVLRRRQRELEAIVQARTSDLSAANEQLQELSLRDPLTGLRNRRFVAQHLESDIALALRRYEDWRANPAGEPPLDADILFFLIDLDHFKEVNDTYGHPGGDEVLVQMRDRLSEVFRDSDFVVRWGGDEFLTVARGSRRTEAGMLAERIRETVVERRFSTSADHSVATTVSVGFAAFPFLTSDPNALSWQQVMAIADQALYLAKEAGRNTWAGLAASARSDPAVLGRTATSAEKLVREGALEVIAPQAAAQEAR